MICNADKLKKFISDVMKSAGLPEMDSKNFAESLINADMRGISSHGTTHMKTYYKRLRDGIVDPKAVPEIVSEMPSFVIIDGNNAMGVVSGTLRWRHVYAKQRRPVHALLVSAVETIMDMPDTMHRWQQKRE